MSVAHDPGASYFRRLSSDLFEPTDHVGGAWNPEEQHIAPALGLLAHLVEADRDQRRDDGLHLARAGYDILGVIPMEPVEAAVRVLRPGRTIELVEATLTHHGRPALMLRAWLLQSIRIQELAGSSFAELPPIESLDRWDPTEQWPGGFIRSVEGRRRLIAPGRAQCWARTGVALLDSEPVSSSARTLGLIDLANGLAPRVEPDVAVFPNVDTSATLFRPPAGDWVGYDVTASFGAGGVGLTDSVLHDESGPFGTSSQTLTIRPRG